MRQALLIILVAATIWSVPLAATASADGVGPTNFRSRITKVKPQPQGIEISIVGSDSFVQVAADRGTKVMIPGYDGEQYLRIDADGSVWRNRSSPATYLNSSRDGQGRLPEDLPDANNEDWQRIGSDGLVAWHDHRIHLMSNSVPQVTDGDPISLWEIPMTVDGREVVVHGRLDRSENILAWPAALAAVIGAALFVRIRRRRNESAPLTMAVASIVALGIAATIQVANPPDSGASPLPLILSAASLAAAFAAIAPGERAPIYRLATVLGSAALLIGWLIPHLGAFWMPYVPGAAPGWVVRVGTAWVTAAVAAVAGSVLSDPTVLTRSGAR